MTDRIHVLATFDTHEDLLAAMRRAASWIKIDASEMQAVLTMRDEQAVKVLLSPDEYSEREVELATEVWVAYIDAIAASFDAQRKTPATEAAGADR